MIAKSYTLSSKDVRFLVYRRQRYTIPGGVVYHFPQYPNRSYNQFTLQITTKFHKRATKRNRVKRLFFDTIGKYSSLTTPFHNTYRKVLVMLDPLVIQQCGDRSDSHQLQTIIQTLVHEMSARMPLPQKVR